MVRNAWVIAGVVAAATVAFYVLVYNKPHRTAEKVDVKISAADLAAAFADDEQAANEKYLDKVLQVSGIFMKVEERGASTTVLLGASVGSESVRCTLGSDAGPLPDGLRTGDPLVIKGICTGRLLDVVLIDCKIVPDED